MKMLAIESYEGPKTEEEALSSIVGMLSASGSALRLHEAIDAMAAYTMQNGRFLDKETVAGHVGDSSHELHMVAGKACNAAIASMVMIGSIALIRHVKSKLKDGADVTDAASMAAFITKSIGILGGGVKDGKECDCPNCTAKREALNDLKAKLASGLGGLGGLGGSEPSEEKPAKRFDFN